jgi:hypothetical protein
VHLGMLLCLDREQRLIYILGEILDVTDAVGAELLEISRENFRQQLARARRDLHSFMNDRCGLVNRSNPCRCAKKTRGFMQAGYVDPESSCSRASASNRSMRLRGRVWRPSQSSTHSTRRCFGGTLFISRAILCRR